jgi:O-antigen ligase
MLVVAGVAGAMGLRAPATAAASRQAKRLALALCLVGLGALVQLVPLSRDTLVRVSPSTDRFLQAYNLAYATAANGSASPAAAARHPLSIRPDRTRLAIAFLATLGILLVGTVRSVSAQNAYRLAAVVTILGLALALAGIIQHATFNGKIYGFWRPRYLEAIPFGPFVNRNHFAGWMLMALPLTLGYLLALSMSGRPVKRDLRSRLVRLASRESSQVLLVAIAVAVMGLALVMTLSRSGIGCFAVALAITAVVVLKRDGGWVGRAAAVTFFVVVATAIAGWVGVDTLSERLLASSSAFESRLLPWTAAQRIVTDFPLGGTGLNTFGVAMLSYQATPGPVHFAEAHNDFLQFAAEGGLLLGVPALALLLMIVRDGARRIRAEASTRTYWIRVGAATGLIAIGLQEAVDFSLQIPANAVLFVVLVSILLHTSDIKGSRPSCPQNTTR